MILIHTWIKSSPWTEVNTRTILFSWGVVQWQRREMGMQRKKRVKGKRKTNRKYKYGAFLTPSFLRLLFQGKYSKTTNEKKKQKALPKKLKIVVGVKCNAPWQQNTAAVNNQLQLLMRGHSNSQLTPYTLPALNTLQRKETVRTWLISKFKDGRAKTVGVADEADSLGTRTIQGSLNLLDSGADKVINSRHRLQVKLSWWQAAHKYLKCYCN